MIDLTDRIVQHVRAIRHDGEVYLHADTVATFLDRMAAEFASATFVDGGEAAEALRDIATNMRTFGMNRAPTTGVKQ